MADANFAVLYRICDQQVRDYIKKQERASLERRHFRRNIKEFILEIWF